jgi:hypothetical protein
MTKYQGLQYSDTSSATLAGLKQDIYFLAKCNANSIADGDLNRIINKYYAQLQEVVRAVNENFYMIVATTDLIISDGSYLYPDGVTGFTPAPAYEKIKSIWVAFQPQDKTNPLPTEYIKVDCIDPDSITDPEYTFSNESPKASMFGNYFVLLPLVTDVTKFPVTNGVKMYYIADIDKLTNPIDVPKIFPSFHDAITQGSLIDIHARLGNDVASQKAEVTFKKRLSEIQSYASARFPAELGEVEGQSKGGGWDYNFGYNSMS